MISFIKGLFGSKKAAEPTQPHPLEIAKYNPLLPAQEQVDKVLATKEWPFPTSTQPAASNDVVEPAPVAPAPVAVKKPRKPRAKK